jgi:5'-3' exonuclease
LFVEGGGQVRAIVGEGKGEWEVRNTSPPAIMFFLAYIHRFSLESINFYLLYLSLMREYLELEFRDIEPMLPFNYNLQRVIDDFILLAILVRIDFLPNLPDLHIHENGLEQLLDVYKKICLR